MRDTELQILSNGQYVVVDIDQSTVFPFNLQFSDIDNPTVTKIPFSASINIPRTKDNDELFGNLWGMDSVSGSKYDPLSRVDFRLYVGQTLFQTGYIKLENITPKAYSIRLFGGLGDFFYTLANMRLRDLNHGNTFNHIINKQTIYNYWQNNQLLNTSGRNIGTFFGYCMTYQGEYDNFDSDTLVESGQEPQEVTWRADVNKTYSSPTLNEHKRTELANGSLFYGEFRSYYQRPMLRVDPIIAKIREYMATQGWTIEMDSSFFNGWNPYVTDLWVVMPQLETENAESGIHYNASFPNGTNTYNIAPSSSFAVLERIVEPISGGIKRGERTLVRVNIPLKFTATNPVSTQYYEYLQYKRNSITVEVELRWANQTRTIRYAYDGSRALVMDQNNLQWKRPESFAAGSNADFEYQRAGEGSEGDAPGTVFEFREAIEIEPSDAGDRDIYVTIAISGDTWWHRYAHGITNRGYGLKVELQEGAGITISNAAESGTRTGAEIAYTDIVRTEETLFDFLTSYSKIFGLLYVKDLNRKHVSIMTRNTFFGQQQRVDWTEKIDYSRDVVTSLAPFEYRYGVFEWTALGTKYENDYLNKTSTSYGSFRFDNGYQLSDESKNYLDGIIFSNGIIATDYSQYYLGRTGTLYQDNKALLHLEDNSGSRVDANMVLAFRVGPQRLSKRFLITDDIAEMYDYGYAWTTSGAQSAYTIPQLSRVVERAGEQYSLNFGRPSIAYSPGEITGTDGMGGETLYVRFWQSYLNDIFSRDNRVMTCYVYLTVFDVQGQLFNKFVFINNTAWRVVKVYNYNPLSPDPVKVDLMRVQDIGNYIGQRYISGNLIIINTAAPPEVIYDSSGQTGPNQNPVVREVANYGQTVNYRIQSTGLWRIGEADLPVTPVSGDPGETMIRITVPPNTEGTTQSFNIPIIWGSTTTFLQLVRYGSWEVYARSNVGNAYINGLPSPQSVENGTVITLSTNAPAGYTFLYWTINGANYFTQEYSMTVNSSVNAVARWEDSSQVVLVYNIQDSELVVDGQTKTGLFWALNIGQEYTFRYTGVRPQFNGIVFDDEPGVRPGNVAVKIIEATTTSVAIVLSNVVLTIEVANNTAVAFDVSALRLVASDGSEVVTFDGSVEAMSTATIYGRTNFRQTESPYRLEYSGLDNVEISQTTFTNYGYYEVTVTVSEPELHTLSVTAINRSADQTEAFNIDVQGGEITSTIPIPAISAGDSSTETVELPQGTYTLTPAAEGWGGTQDIELTDAGANTSFEYVTTTGMLVVLVTNNTTETLSDYEVTVTYQDGREIERVLLVSIAPSETAASAQMSLPIGTYMVVPPEGQQAQQALVSTNAVTNIAIAIEPPPEPDPGE